MADFAAGKWTLVDTTGFDEYMKAVGVGMVMRKMAAAIKPTQIVEVEGDRWTIKTLTTLKNTEIAFVLGEEFEEVTGDGRKLKTTVTLEGQKLIQTQVGEVDSILTREWDGDTMIMTLKAKDAVCTRTYKRAV
ncbi:FABP1-like protein [Mya arenaria]|uniref:FABP1-like protein n=1 Tax=Mya arenaria TaxID=6604 RepID=A0ABY7DYP5_MYAAR|nr:sodium/calcium exchanger regulatory protein 1-like [Mya arenaria]WAR02870.1 FABP1-like protein [Mya arenaria]